MPNLNEIINTKEKLAVLVFVVVTILVLAVYAVVKQMFRG